MNKLYTKTIIFLFALIFAIGIIIPFDLVHKSIDILEGVGQGFSNLHTLYINSSDSSPNGGIMEDTVPYEDPANPVLAVDEPFVEVLATITAYTSSVEETDDTPCLSASGHNICNLPDWVIQKMNDKGVNPYLSHTGIIACPKEYKMGSNVFEIQGQKYICLDRMNSRYDGQERFDIYFGMDRQGALNFGRQTLEVKIYK